MTARVAPRGRPRPRRAAFTLIELMGVLLIIAILIAIALPAYQSVVTSARVASARAEIASIENAIATFNAEFGSDPPSRIDFVPIGSPPQLKPQTKAILRKMFPQISFDAVLLGDLADAGLLGEELVGGEALVFFLGGVRKFEDANNDGTRDPGELLTNELVGFSKNPANPFAQPTPGQSNRLGPFFEFDIGRLSAAADASADPGTTQQLVYTDSLPGQSRPLAYASTAATGGYNKNDVIAATQTMTDLYRKSAGGPYWNPNSYQIISPGFDGQYGVGGAYDPNSTASLDGRDADNITNFSEGQLGG